MSRTPTLTINTSSTIPKHAADDPNNDNDGYNSRPYEESPLSSPGILSPSHWDGFWLPQHYGGYGHDHHDFYDGYSDSGYDYVWYDSWNYEYGESFHYPRLDSLYQDLRTLARGAQRRRKHLEKYHRTNLGSSVAPKSIPYSLALQTPNSKLVPELELWANVGFGSQFNYLLHPKNQPKKLTIKGEKRRVYVMARIARDLTLGDRCTCYICRYRRSRLQKFKTTWLKGKFEEETREAKDREWEEMERQRGIMAWWEEPHEGEDVDEDEDEDENEVAESTRTEDGVEEVPNNWAKLVDDAVNVWEGKRRRVAEQMGWVVCNHNDQITSSPSSTHSAPFSPRPHCNNCVGSSSASTIVNVVEVDDNHEDLESELEWDIVSVGVDSGSNCV